MINELFYQSMSAFNGIGNNVRGMGGGFGRGIGIPMIDVGIGAEIIYSFVIIICSLMIYFGTKELYELSNYKGLKYFRKAFLFFAFAYFFRSFIKFINLYVDFRELFSFNPKLFPLISLGLFMYFSIMAIFYLTYSVMWKKWNGKTKNIFLFHLIALSISIVIALFSHSILYLLINVIILVFSSIIVIYAHNENKSKKKKSKLFVIYILLFLFFVLNVIDILIPNFLQTAQLFIYLASSAIFLFILYKVLKNSGSD